MQPAFWFVDGFTLVLGPIFVAMVIFLTSSVVFLTYWIGLPYYQEHKSFALLCFLVVLGHYILVNIVFHFLSALLIHPGTIPADTVNLTQVSTNSLSCYLLFSGGCNLQEMHPAQTTSNPPLQCLQQLHLEDGPPLPLAQQLRRPPQPQALLPLHGVHGARLRLPHGPWL